MIYEYLYRKKEKGVIHYIFKDYSGKQFSFTSSDIKSNKKDTFDGIGISSKDNRIYVKGKHQNKKKTISRYINTLSINSGRNLYNLVSTYRIFKQRDIVSSIMEYVNSRFTPTKSFCILYGLRRTGKTVAMLHAIDNMITSGINIDRICYVLPSMGESPTNIDELLRFLENTHYDYIFIDEITMVHGLINKLNIISDIIMVNNPNKRLVVTGTDSFVFSEAFETTLHGRTYTINSTWINANEFLRIKEVQSLMDSQSNAIAKLGILYPESYNSIQNASNEINVSIFNNIKNTVSRNKDFKTSINELLLKMDSSIFVYLAYVIIYNAAEAQNYLDLNKHLITLNKHIEDRLIAYGGMENYSSNKFKSAKLIIMQSLYNLLQSLNVIYKIENFADDDDKQGIKKITDVKPICMIQSLLYILRTQKKVTNEILGLLFENFIISQVIMYNTKYNRFNSISYIKYQYKGKEHEVDLLLYNPNKAYAIEIKYSNYTDTSFKKHLVDSSLDLVIGNDVVKYIIYRGKTIIGDVFSYINVDDFLLNLDKWLK